MKVSFQDIPKHYSSLLDQIEEQTIKVLYSEFSFLYLPIILENDKKEVKDFLLCFLKDFKFITYHFSSISEKIPCPISLTNKDKENLSPNQIILVDAIFCVEGKCIIIEKILKSIINEICDELKSQNISIINTNFDRSENNENTEKELKIEMENFCNDNKIKNTIIKNIFVKCTINSIICYMIRRYFYPTDYFKDQSFFYYVSPSKFLEDEFKKILSGYFFEEFLFTKKSEIPYLLESIISNNIDYNKTRSYQEFVENNFIILRQIYTNDDYIFYLVIHRTTLYIFTLKKLKHISYTNTFMREEKFCANYVHRCFTRFYGFLKDKKRINTIGFVYEYMCNGSLNSFISSNLQRITNLNLFTIINRLAQGIDFLHSNSLIHRDLKPSNILIDHDYIPYISDFETIRPVQISTYQEMTYDFGTEGFSSPEQNNGLPVSYPADIYSFGKIILYLFHSKYNDDKHISKSFENLYKNCIKYSPEERPTIKEIKNIIINEILCDYYLEQFLSNDGINHEDFRCEKYLIQFIYENILIQQEDFESLKRYGERFFGYAFEFTLNLNSKEDYILYQGSINFMCDISKSKKYLKMVKHMNKSQKMLGNIYYEEKKYLKALKYYELAKSYNSIGGMYYFGKGVKRNYEIAKKYYELAVKQNNIHSFGNLGLLYLNGLGTPKDIPKAIHYFTLGAEKGGAFSLLQLGNLYYKGNNGVEINYTLAANYFEKAAMKEDTMAYLMLGNLYYHGRGVKQDYLTAKFYFEKASKAKVPKSHEKLGNLYFNGFGVQQNYSMAINYYIISANTNNPHSQYLLGYFFSTDDIFNIELEIATKYYMKCINNKQKISSYSTDIYSHSYYSKSNKYAYISANDLGLIYLFEFQDIEKANQFIKQSAFGEYPFGQNNFGLMNQFYLNNIEDAKYMYQRASKNKFALSEYNQGYILENEGKIEESIQFYIRAIELKDEPLIFRNKQHYDKRLDISKKFIICFTNLKLVDYYLSKTNYNKAKKYFIKAFAEIISNDDSYKFQFQFHKKYLFAYLKLFIFKCPLFISLEPYLYLPINRISKNKEKEFLTNCMKRKFNEVNVLDTLKFTNAGDLFDFVINENEFKKLFMKEIKDIILLMNNILYTKPYNILFGRINMKRNKKLTNNNLNSYAKDINELFYEGFGFTI